MVVQPPRIRWRHFRLEHDLATGGLMPDTQEGVGVAAPPPPGLRNPVAPSLEGISGQGQAAPGLPGEQSLKGDGQARLVGSGHRLQERICPLGLRPVPGRPQQADQHRGALDIPRGLRPVDRDQGPEHRVGPKLDNRIHAQGGQRLHGASEGDRLTGLAAPVSPIHRHAGLHHPSRHVADQRDSGRRDYDIREECLQVVEGRFHQRAVVGGAGRQPSHLHTLFLHAVRKGVHLRGRTADHLVSAVVHRNTEVGGAAGFIPFGHLRLHPAFGGEHRGHRPGAGKGRHQRPPGGGEPESLFKGEDSGGMRGRNLAQAMSQHHLGPDPHALPEGGEGALQGIDGRLGPRRVLQITCRGGPAEHNIQQ